jgi:phosphoenolpyruvate carboxykinase (GTP)
MGREVVNPPRIFCVNWFLTDKDGNFLWPGFGENMRVLKWIVERVKGKAFAIESPLGWMPRYEDMDWKGLEEITPELFNDLEAINRELWKKEVISHEELFVRLYDRLPKEFLYMRQLILSALWRSPEHWEISYDI